MASMQCYIPANEMCQQMCSENSYGFGHKESHQEHQYGGHAMSGGYGMSGGQTHQYGQTHAYNPNHTVPKPETHCYSQTQQSYYLDTNTVRPGQSYGQAYGQGQHIDHGLANGQSPCSVAQTHGHYSGHAQNGSHQTSYGMACHGKTEKHKKKANMCKTKCRSGYRSGGDSGSGSDCDSD